MFLHRSLFALPPFVNLPPCCQCTTGVLPRRSCMHAGLAGFLFVLLLLLPPSPLAAAPNGGGDGLVCREGVAWVGRLSSTQSFEWRFFRKNLTRSMNISCVGVQVVDDTCNLTGFQLSMSIDQIPRVDKDLPLGRQVTVLKTDFGQMAQWWVAASATNECPASVIVSIALAAPPLLVCPAPGDSEPCSDHGFCEYSYPLTSPAVCRCDQSKKAGYWNGTACEDCDGRHFGRRCRGDVRCHPEHGVCQAGSCFGLGGSGSCSTCQPGFCGRECDRPVSCQPAGLCLEGTCYGITGTGLCDACDVGHSNTNCSQPVLCDKDHGICEGPADPRPCYGPTGSGYCTRCQPYHRGLNCGEAVPCSAAHGECREGDGQCYGPNSTGVCTSCAPTHYGQYCDQAVRCDTRRGLCDGKTCSGTTGTGGCTRCKSDVWTGPHFTLRHPGVRRLAARPRLPTARQQEPPAPLPLRQPSLLQLRARFGGRGDPLR